MPETMSNAGKAPLLSATPKPGDFPIGSSESRAAARMLAERKDTRNQIVGNPYLYRIKRGGDPGLYWEKEPWSGNTPVCSACGTPYRRKPTHPGWVFFQAECLWRCNGVADEIAPSGSHQELEAEHDD